MNGQLWAFGLVLHAERLADVIRRARVSNRDVMFGNDYFQLNDKPIDDALQWHNIA